MTQCSFILMRTFLPEDIDILKVFSRGGTSEVLAGIINDTGSIVCVKEMPFNRMSNPKSVLSERESLSVLNDLNDPRICKLLGTMKSNDAVSLILSLCEGLPLHSLYRRVQLPEASVRHILRNLIEVLQKVHACGLIYRDVKAANVVVNPSNGLVQLVDFGLCKRLEASKDNREDQWVGTLHASSPEMLAIREDRGGTYGLPAEWWAVGVLGYEMLFGEPPFGFQPTSKSFEKDIFLDKTVSSLFRDFLSQLLTVDESQRLGSKDGADEILSHAWFNEVDREEDQINFVRACLDLDPHQRGIFIFDLKAITNDDDDCAKDINLENDPFKDF